MAGEAARRQLLERDEAAAYLRVSLRSFARHAAKEIPRITIGSKVLYDVEDLDAWIDSRKSHTEPTVTVVRVRSASASRISASDAISPRAKQILDAQKRRRTRSLKR